MFVPKILEMSGNEFLILIVCSPREEMKRKLTSNPLGGRGDVGPLRSTFDEKLSHSKSYCMRKAKVGEKRK